MTDPENAAQATDDPYPRIVTRLFPKAKLTARQRLTGGVSADVYRLDVQLADGDTRQLVLRAHGATHAGHAAELEYQLMDALYRGGVPVPEPLLVDTSGSLLADPYLIMTFIEGETALPEPQQDHYVDKMAQALAKIHALPTHDLPALPERNDTLPEVFDYLPEGSEWAALRAHLETLTDTAYRGAPRLLHGDFWPENLLWQGGEIAAVLDWEDAAIGDPVSDVAAARVELRYRFGKPIMEQFTRAYAEHHDVDRERLALWQVYVAAAAHRFMGEWGLEPTFEAHMRREALASVREAGAALMSQADF